MPLKSSVLGAAACCMLMLPSAIDAFAVSPAAPMGLRAGALSRGHRAGLPVFMVASQGLTAKQDELLRLIASTDMAREEQPDTTNQINGLIDELASQGKGFDEKTADGEWYLVYNRNADGSPALQKASAKVESVGGSTANFDISQGKFFNVAEILGGKGKLAATVEYGPSDDNAGTRITCDIVDASLQLFSLPAIPLPLRVKGGFLDFLFLDENMRITKGNQGGTFVHVRSSKLKEYWGVQK